ncbi:protein ENHANCED DOWNY MILDEW 2-like isoform X1 [Lycium barbarum]|uniref:protein ENHANCED DOWNY MILDEW 2-like isoform X1 n=1 Tax=Lycium barbarum TaxID=112863 RepID=UPI00293EA534|nr:protein ENHANCED DOWNY MILDEW 2-like isoform X1 [Lycium barbarum]XP_060176110.1 protein ENHANCED DOWNY MILDEW 2-like isoform X1 [Lycium barbarum]XP_060176111.1 protein ENHANCED DOWNY MILDEW 2-like isoform X1 [Lycium barbarum]XP_060176112.1 protein ENHANCED DOWNY MILDEW 2-like isoform X1 [Lycium barbarum]
MASSDEEGEIVADCISNYHFLDLNGGPVSFSILPLLWGEDDIFGALNEELVLRGTSDDGLQHIYKNVLAWRFELSYALPEIHVLSKDKIWIKLLKPRKSYRDTIRTILITVHFLHFVKKNPDTFGETVWNYIRKILSSYEVLPSKDDLLEHMPTIKEAARRDKDLSSSKSFNAFLLETSQTTIHGYEQCNQAKRRPQFIIETDNDADSGADDDSDEDEDETFDHVCALCDDGGEILCCEGRCIRSFHPTVESGAGSCCESLAYRNHQAIQTFLCKNCRYQQHQCFACGLLGSSDKSTGAEVFPCVSATCGHFFHPKCVSELLYPDDKCRALELQKEIVAGESFTCPAHKCFICKQGEDKKSYELQFAICRRCPKAYHRRCLPRCISFEPSNYDKSIQKRAWNDLLPRRILIYCMDHKIIPKIGTPKRDHIVFPHIDGKANSQSSGLPSGPVRILSRRSKVLGVLTETRLLNMKRPSEVRHNAAEVGDSYGKGKPFKRPTQEKGKWKAPLDTKLVCTPQSTSSGKTVSVRPIVPVMKKASGTQQLADNELKKRMMTLIKNSTASFNVEEFVNEQYRKCIDSNSRNFFTDKDITLGKVQNSVNAIRVALKKLDEGCSIEDAKAVCEPEILSQIFRWKKKLGSYLAPFLNGMRYTSFGRHFTKVDKLKEVVDRLRWYVQDGDTMVDFCCGSNDFSCLMKEELDRMGKTCQFINFDVVHPKNDFNFEKRDWMTVGLRDLPEGSKLIMGFNPPFSKAYEFISKALTFRPKLLIITVPKETKRLDERKKNPYDIIWEDDVILAGKSFYLPGSINVHNQQMEQWNIASPPLYLWSRPDWTAKHKAVAIERGHIRKDSQMSEAERNKVNTGVTNYLMQETRDCYGDFSDIMTSCGDINSLLDDIPEIPIDAEYNQNQRFGVPELEYGFGNSQEVLGCEAKDENETSQAEDMCTDMDLSPMNSPLH